MFVIKRNGTRQPIYYDKITARNMKLAADLAVDTTLLSQNVIRGLNSGMTTRDIDQLSCESAINRSIYEPDYGVLSSRIAWNDLHKNTPSTFRECITTLYNNHVGDKHYPLITKEIYDFAMLHIDRIESEIDYNRDYDFDYFAFKMLSRSYLLRVNGQIVERAQSMFMRASLGIHGPSRLNGIVHPGDIDKVIQTYQCLRDKKFIHASPTLFNACSPRPQMSSCFLLSCPDSLGDDEYNADGTIADDNFTEDSLMTCATHCAKISKHSGGIGVDIGFVRAAGSKIGTSGGKSEGLVPLAQIYNTIARYANQGGKRKGAVALYVQPWHPDIVDFLSLKTKNGIEDRKARDIFPALWIPDLFFKRLESNGSWSLFCPGSYPELVTLYGDEFEARYTELERQGKAMATITAYELWEKILKSIDESGIPYMMAKDSVNKKSNQKNIGPIYCSNLCTEIVEYHDPKSIAVCNLASLSLPAFVRDGKFDFAELGRMTEMVTENLNCIIDRNYAPVRYCAKNNLNYRPIGIGIQGLADVFALLGLPWEGDTPGSAHPYSRALNQAIFEVIYFHALKRSSELAQRDGSYSKFEGSPASQGILQYHMWGVTPITETGKPEYNIPVLDWNGLIAKVKTGLRNSLLVAPMPTASTSYILGNNECFEPFTSNIYSRKVLAGDFPLVNQHLYRDLSAIGKWNKETVDKIIKAEGSVQGLDIPQHIKNRYKTVWEIPQRIIIDMAADRGAFIDQSQSMNIFMARPTPSKLSSMYMYAWKLGLKTLSYYVRSHAAVDAVQFTIMDTSDPTKKREKDKTTTTSTTSTSTATKLPEEVECTDDICVSCGS
jgi:ribonucleoside-diphosphate reductase alpha chain